MSVRITAELNPASKERTVLTTEPKPIIDILRELNSGFPPEYARVCRNGEIVKDFSIAARDGDVLAVKFVPYGDSPRDAGAGMKLGGWGLMVLGGLMLSGMAWKLMKIEVKRK